MPASRVLAILLALVAVVIACGQAPTDSLSRLPKTIGGETRLYDVTEGPEFRDDSGWEMGVLKATKMPASAMTAATGFTSPALGYSDLYAAGHADTVFAKPELAELCRQRGWPFRPWTDFASVAAEIDADLAAGRLDGIGSPVFRCGPEAWPTGTTAPRWGGLMGPPAVRPSPEPA